jgi:hypothetical protein
VPERASSSLTGPTESRLRGLLGWVLAPATDDAPRPHVVAATVVRVTLGLLWLWNVNWKVPPDFGEADRKGLYEFTSYAVSHPVFAPYSWLVEQVVLPALPVFGWGVIVAETVLAVLLLAGAWVRVAALLGMAQSAAIGLSVAFAPNEWAWAYVLMLVAHLAVLGSSAGRMVAVDAVRAGLTDGRRLATAFGLTAAVVGLVSTLRSFDDPLAANGPVFGSSDWEIGLAGWNLVGGLTLLGVGLLLVAVGRGVRHAAPAAIALALLAFVVLRVQAGATERLLGGGGSSAAVMLVLALVGLILYRHRRSTP